MELDSARYNSSDGNPKYFAIVTLYIMSIIFVSLIVFDSGFFAVDKNIAALLIVFITDCTGLTFVVILIIATHHEKKKATKNCIERKENHWLKCWKIFFLWVFALGCGTRGFFNLSINFPCIFKSETYEGEYVLSTMKDLTWISSCTSLLLLVTFNFRSGIPYTRVSHNSIIVIIATNFVHWFHLLLYDVRIKLNESLPNVTLSTNHYQLDGDCYMNSTIKAALDKAEPYLIPTNTEFLILGASFLLDMCAIGETKGQTPRNYRLKDVTENSSLLSHEVHTRTNENTCDRSLSPYLVITRNFLVKMALTTILFLAIMITITKTVGKYRIGEVAVNQAISITMVIILLISTIVAFYKLGTECYLTDSKSKWRVKHFILFLLSFGMMAYDTFSVFAVSVWTAEHGSELQNKITIFTYVCFLITTPCLTILILRANRCKRLRHTTGSVFGVEHCFLALYCINIFYWTLSSIPLYCIICSDIPYKIYGIFWYFIRYTFVPISVYFRFNISMEFLDLYGKLRM